VLAKLLKDAGLTVADVPVECTEPFYLVNTQNRDILLIEPSKLDSEQVFKCLSAGFKYVAETPAVRKPVVYVFDVRHAQVVTKSFSLTMAQTLVRLLNNAVQQRTIEPTINVYAGEGDDALSLAASAINIIGMTLGSAEKMRMPIHFKIIRLEKHTDLIQ
jgi:hypothetical protein